MGMGSSKEKMAMFMSASTKMTCSKEKVLKCLRMTIGMSVHSIRTNNMGKVNFICAVVKHNSVNLLMGKRKSQFKFKITFDV